MSRAYSPDLRVRVLRALKQSPLKRTEIAQQFQICPATLYNWQRSEREEGRTEPKPHAGGRSSEIQIEVLRALVREKNDRTLEELAQLYRARTGQPVGKSTVDRRLKWAKITRKKKDAPGQGATRGAHRAGAGDVSRGDEAAARGGSRLRR